MKILKNRNEENVPSVPEFLSARTRHQSLRLMDTMKKGDWKRVSVGTVLLFCLFGVMVVDNAIRLPKVKRRVNA